MIDLNHLLILAEPGRCLRIACIISTALAVGCNVPEPPILNEPKTGIIYDTEYEKQSQSGKPQPRILEGVWEPYFETLAEPVCVTSWGLKDSTWEILYATNRDSNPSAATSDKVTYGNEVLTRPTLGQSKVQLPHRKRGGEPQQKRAAKLLPIRLKKQQRDETESLATVATAQAVSDDEFQHRLHDQLAQSRQKDVLLFVHGFNVNFESSLIRTAQLGLDIPFNGVLVAYSWPTQGGVLNYESDESVNAASIAPFVEFLSWMIESLPAEAQLKIVVHSMGNRIVLKGVNQLPSQFHNHRPIQTLCLCAPDVGVSDYESLIPGVVERCDHVLLYANASDGALRISKSLHLEQRTGDARIPIAMSGVDLIDCSAVDLSFLGHSYFSGNVSVLGDLFCVLKENKSPSQRTHLKRKQNSRGNEYWVFHQHPNRILWSWHFDEDHHAE